MTKVFIATPPTPLPLPQPDRHYSISSEARAFMVKGDEIETPLTYDVPSKGLYVTDAGASFDFELNVLDTDSKRPIRAVEVESGLVKGFTDRLGRIIMHLPRGRNEVVISGLGYVEEGSFTPRRIEFEPIYLKVDLDSDSIFTVYSTGEIVPGERHEVGNPGHVRGHSSNLESFLREYGWALGIIGVTGVAAYYFGKSRNHAH